MVYKTHRQPHSIWRHASRQAGPGGGRIVKHRRTHASDKSREKTGPCDTALTSPQIVMVTIVSHGDGDSASTTFKRNPTLLHIIARQHFRQFSPLLNNLQLSFKLHRPTTDTSTVSTSKLEFAS